jgi:iron(III) transport system substrate-binding protein
MEAERPLKDVTADSKRKEIVMSFRCRIARLGFCVALCLSLAAPAVAGELNIYFGTSRDLFDPVIQAFGATRPDIKISSYRAPTEELMATIELEIKAGKPRADVIVITASQLFGLQQQHKALEPYAPKGLDKVKKELRDPELLRTPTGVNLSLIQYNTKRITGADIPKKYADLLNPKFNNQIVMTDPRSSSSAHTHIWFLTKFLADAAGEPPYGWSFYKELRKLNAKYVASHGTIRAMVQTGERPLGIQMLNDAMMSIKKGEPAAFVLAEEGSPAEISAASLVKGSRNPNEAKAFVDFLLTEQGQDLMVKLGGMVPVRTDTAFKFPDGRGVADVKLVAVDLAYITPAKRQEHMEKFHEIMR